MGLLMGGVQVEGGGWYVIGEMSIQMGKAPVQTFSILFSKLLTEGAVTTDIETGICYAANMCGEQRKYKPSTRSASSQSGENARS